MSKAFFPLTLTLSLREREQFLMLSALARLCWPLPRCNRSKRSDSRPKRRTILPLPKGEGRGEGKGPARMAPHVSRKIIPRTVELGQTSARVGGFSARL
jgi:hypothetical protein